MKTLSICIIFSVLLPTILSLSCPSWDGCEEILAEYPCPSMDSCPPEDVYDDGCGCCPVCARQRGDTCGGIWEGSPICGKGLRCYKTELRADELEYNQDGVCVNEGDDPFELENALKQKEELQKGEDDVGAEEEEEGVEEEGEQEVEAVEASGGSQEEVEASGEEEPVLEDIALSDLARF